MDIFDFTIGEFQSLQRTRNKAKQYLLYLSNTDSVFSFHSKERRYIAERLNVVEKIHAHIWNAHLEEFPLIKRTLKNIAHGNTYSKSDYNKLLRYALSERELLKIYHINQAIASSAPKYSCFHADENEYPRQFKISLAFTDDYKSELTCFVEHDFETLKNIDFSSPIKIRAHTNLQKLVTETEDIANTAASLRRELPLNYILEHFCDFSMIHSLNSHTLNTLITEQVNDAFFTIASSYRLDVTVKAKPSAFDDGMSKSTSKEFEVLFSAKEHSIENKYIERVIDCNNTLIFLS
jgi:hypothetical protein